MCGHTLPTAASHLFSFNHIKLYSLSISHTAQILAWIVLLDGSLSRKTQNSLGDIFQHCNLFINFTLAKILFLFLHFTTTTNNKKEFFHYPNLQTTFHTTVHVSFLVSGMLQNASQLVD